MTEWSCTLSRPHAASKSFVSMSPRNAPSPAKPRPLLKGKRVVLLFYEPSTRTRSSFEIAAKSLGASDVRIFFSHLVPNTLGIIVVSSTLGLASAILTEAYVSFLGLGVQPPTATWGNMMEQAQSFISQGAWWMWVFPSLFIVLVILSVNLMGDGLRDAFDPHSTRHL